MGINTYARMIQSTGGGFKFDPSPQLAFPIQSEHTFSNNYNNMLKCLCLKNLSLRVVFIIGNKKRKNYCCKKIGVTSLLLVSKGNKPLDKER